MTTRAATRYNSGVDLDLAYLPAHEMAARVAAGEVSPAQLVANAYERLDQVNPTLNCVVTTWREEAMAEAERAGSAVARDEALGPLHGVPVLIKDTTPSAGHRTTLGSFTHEHWVSDHDATIVISLRRAGAIILGATATPEFASMGVTMSPLWGVTRNPWNPERTPGGSSGGAGAAVAAGVVPLAEGTDMGGSVRIPAACCGVTGLKPGIGRIPMDVLPGLFDSISHHGPLARCAADARLFLAATQGPNDADILSLPVPLDLSGPLTGDVRGLRVAVSADLGCYDIEPDQAAAVRQGVEVLAAAGAVVTEVDLVTTPDDLQAWMGLWGVFMATYYGHFTETHADRMEPTVLALIEMGRSMSAVDYKSIELVRTDLWRRVARVLADHDVIVNPARSIGPQLADDPREGTRPIRAEGRLTVEDLATVWNLVPSLPVGVTRCGWDRDQMPVGISVAGRRWQEDSVLNVLRALEVGLPDVHARRPA